MSISIQRGGISHSSETGHWMSNITESDQREWAVCLASSTYFGPMTSLLELVGVLDSQDSCQQVLDSRSRR